MRQVTASLPSTLTRRIFDRLAADNVAPIVGYLVSDELADSGTVLVVGGGQVYRIQQFQNKGVTFAEKPTVEDVRARWDEIAGMDGAVPGTNPVG